MRIAKGPDGFRVSVCATVQPHVDATLHDFPEFFWRWEAVVARLRATAHTEGTAVGENGAQRAGTFNMDGWRVKVAWRVVGDHVEIKRAEF